MWQGSRCGGRWYSCGSRRWRSNWKRWNWPCGAGRNGTVSSWPRICQSAWRTIYCNCPDKFWRSETSTLVLQLCHSHARWNNCASETFKVTVHEIIQFLMFTASGNNNYYCLSSCKIGHKLSLPSHDCSINQTNNICLFKRHRCNLFTCKGMVISANSLMVCHLWRIDMPVLP